MTKLSPYETVLEAWRRTGYIGMSQPCNEDAARRQAYVVAQSMEKRAKALVDIAVKEVQAVTKPIDLSKGMSAAYIQLKFTGVK